MTIAIRRSHWEEMQAHVASESPLEACGILAGHHGQSVAVFSARNLLNSPTRFQIHPQDQIRIFYQLEHRGWDLLAIYHSHPAGPPHPSARDVSDAVDPDYAHLIWSPQPSGWDCHAFRIIYGKIEPVRIQQVA